ncbi:MAG TPA: peptidoglycan-binding protein [Chthoniobacterales bacterium]|jgi:hypothetical protein
MKRTLIAICITTVALAVGATAAEQHPKRAAGKGKAAATASVQSGKRGNVQHAQVNARQNVSTHRNVSARSFNRTANVNNHTNAQLQSRSVAKANKAAVQQRNVRRTRATTNNAVAATSTTQGRRQALHEQRAQQRALAGSNQNNVRVNRARSVNRNVSVVNNWRGERFAGQRYAAFRNYHRAWHDRGWYDTHYGTSLTFVFGAPYFWNSGYWYPAWGYNPGYVYPYDGPIYGASHLTPDQIVMNVQAQLRNDGYYDGAIDGVLGSRTRYALAAFQADHGLAVTSAVDEPTLATLGV